jgi:hypothetical protein
VFIFNSLFPDFIFVKRNFNIYYAVSLSSPPPLIRQLYHAESLHPPVNPVKHAVVKETIKQTLCNYNFITMYVLPCSLHHFLFFIVCSLLMPLRLGFLHISIKYYILVFVFNIKVYTTKYTVTVRNAEMLVLMYSIITCTAWIFL